MKWFPFIIECRDLVESGLYPPGTNCCKRCHKCDRRNEKVISAPPDKETGFVETVEEFDGGTPLGRILLSFCCNVGHVALSRSEVAQLVWERRRQVAAELRARRENSLFTEEGMVSLGKMLEASIH